ncbi:MAG TPA: MBL fold metallo-hydrolase [Ktedonobacteraceae bacterium]|nr:MBL fold metallo-hydrolase [Ktedonobacteraceae bacterium]
METAIEDKQQFPPIAQQPRRVHTITDRFSMVNTYLIHDERIVVVDPCSVLNARLLLDYLQHFLHRAATDIDLIVLTSLHPDHTGGITSLRQACSAPVAASILARKLVEPWQESNRTFIYPPHALNEAERVSMTHALELSTASYARQVQLVDIWLEDVAGLPNHLDWRVIASPGLTPESLCLYNPFSYELLSGDTIIATERSGAGFNPQERASMLLRAGRNRWQQEQTLQVLRDLKVHYLYPGHGRQILARQAIRSIRVE